MHEQTIIDDLLSKLDLHMCNLVNVSLVCSEQALREHLQLDIDAGKRNKTILEKSAQRLHLYTALATIKVDVSECSAQQVALKLKELGNTVE